MFAVKKIGSFAYLKSLNMLMLVRKIFLTSPPDNIVGKNLHNLVKILGNIGQSMTTPLPPPPPMLMASRRPCVQTLWFAIKFDKLANLFQEISLP